MGCTLRFWSAGHPLSAMFRWAERAGRLSRPTKLPPETIGAALLSHRPVDMDLAVRKQPLTLVFDQPVFVLPGHGHPAAALFGG